MRAVYSLLALILAAMVGALAAASSKVLLAAAAAVVVSGAAFAIFAWRQSVSRRRRGPRIPLPRLLAGSAIVCYLMSTLVFRGRTSADIASNPLDSAGLIRVAFLAGAVLLGLITLSVCTTMGIRMPRLETPAKIYLLYVALCVLSIVEAVDIFYAAFSIMDLSIAVFVMVVAIRAFRGDAMALLRVIFGFLAGLVGTTLVGVVVWPSRALVAYPGSPIPIRLAGVFPDLSFNTLGEFGLFFFAAGLAGMKPRRTLVISGLALVVLSQYRTGYIACTLMVFVYLIAQRKLSHLLVASGLGGAVFILAQSAGFQSLWARGSTSQNVDSLSGRASYWSLAFKAVERSPIIGLGLRSGTRFEVLVTADSGTSTVHNTWVEALVGVGVLGLATLLAAFLLTSVFAYRRRNTLEGLVALLLLVAILVRSLTGTTIEIGGVGAPVFVAAIFLTARRQRKRGKPPDLPEPAPELELAPSS